MKECLPLSNFKYIHLHRIQKGIFIWYVYFTNDNNILEEWK